MFQTFSIVIIRNCYDDSTVLDYTPVSMSIVVTLSKTDNLLCERLNGGVDLTIKILDNTQNTTLL